ncbi:hypothetical protein L596_006869 [Steinernema carpocapsae]|uniref:Dystroglycan C-terminal domain-containing protein n=1 Tax=Steinernema carpocapsae TaxID=34508 RepID=A0A4U5P775_STECR|nr:hypothetical protein L596_006869 [Steinernema carpocapsae]
MRRATVSMLITFQMIALVVNGQWRPLWNEIGTDIEAVEIIATIGTPSTPTTSNRTANENATSILPSTDFRSSTMDPPTLRTTTSKKSTKPLSTTKAKFSSTTEEAIEEPESVVSSRRRKKQEESGVKAVVLIPICVVAALIIIAIIVIVCVCRRRHKKAKKAEALERARKTSTPVFAGKQPIPASPSTPSPMHADELMVPEKKFAEGKYRPYHMPVNAFKHVGPVKMDMNPTGEQKHLFGEVADEEAPNNLEVAFDLENNLVFDIGSEVEHVYDGDILLPKKASLPPPPSPASPFSPSFPEDGKF